jgi:hypothetical protein
LSKSAKLIKETDHGLALVKGAEPSWWSADEVMQGFPSPQQVRSWWEEEHPTSPHGIDKIDEHSNLQNQWNTGNTGNSQNAWNHDSESIPGSGISESGPGKGNAHNKEQMIPVTPTIPGVNTNGHHDGPLQPTLDRFPPLGERQEDAEGTLAEEVRNLLAQDTAADDLKENQ